MEKGPASTARKEQIKNILTDRERGDFSIPANGGSLLVEAPPATDCHGSRPTGTTPAPGAPPLDLAAAGQHLSLCMTGGRDPRQSQQQFCHRSNLDSGIEPCMPHDGQVGTITAPRPLGSRFHVQRRAPRSRKGVAGILPTNAEAKFEA